jgi:hypothetical protein
MGDRPRCGLRIRLAALAGEPVGRSAVGHQVADIICKRHTPRSTLLGRVDRRGRGVEGLDSHGSLCDRFVVHDVRAQHDHVGQAGGLHRVKQHPPRTGRSTPQDAACNQVDEIIRVHSVVPMVARDG